MAGANTPIRLSCLITNYNQIAWIEEAVESILNQNMDFAYEILIGENTFPFWMETIIFVIGTTSSKR